MIESVPASAPVTPPATGASNMVMPFSAKAAHSLRTVVGELLDRSM
jgi:hypothetical protein